jgi:3-deoxy-D-manno-octulosonate 8-phosphate phosphatase KdsC-like HAD superfamily phosphatase
MSAIPVRLVNFNIGSYLTIRRLHLDAEGQEYRETDLSDGDGIRTPRECSIQASFLQ